MSINHLTRATAVVLSTVLWIAALAPPTRAQDEEPSADDEAPEAEGDAAWGVAPSRDPDAQSRRPFFVYDVAAGETIEDRITLLNFTDEPASFLLYATDAFNAADGGFALQNQDVTPVDVGTWVDIDVFNYTVPAHRSADIPFTMIVPANAPSGDHVGGIVVENLTEQATAGEQEDPSVVLQRRIGARIYARVAGPIAPRLDITDIEVEHDQPPFSVLSGDGTATVTYTLKNNGNVVLTPSTKVEVTGFFGRTVASLDPEELPELLPHSSVTVTQEIPGATALPPAEHLTVKVSASAEGAAVTRSTGLWAISWGLVVALLAAVVGLIVWRRRRRRASPVSAPRELVDARG